MTNLIKKLVVVFLLFFSFVQVPLQARGYDEDEQININVYAHLSPAIVAIDAQLKEGISSGTGCIISSDGTILTSSHVIDDATDIDVTVSSGKVYKAKVLSVLGENNDLILIKIDAKERLPIVKLGDSEGVRVGQKVLAIGNPFGFSGTLTQGIVSRIDYVKNKIQTDAAINPGNSGGPLLNYRGEVIGMNTAIIQGAQGLGFAIPINTAQKIAEEIIAKGRVDHPYLGIQMVTLTPEVKEKIIARFGDKINLSANEGILLIRIVANSPAAVSGLRPGDVIKSINNQPVLKVDEVQRIVENSKIGIPLQVQVDRNGKVSQFLVKPAPLPVNKEN
jgi:S1-C subfamily serine protease